MSHSIDKLLAERGLKDRALESTAEGITISDARQPDHPIIYANAGFERLTGYLAEEISGRNCRFLQGQETNPATVDEIRKRIRESRDCTVEILNYRKDGKPFWNRLSITPVRDAGGETTHFIGVQSDISERMKVEEELREAKAELEGLYRELKKDMDAAARIQRSMLPTKPPRVDGLRFAWKFQPCAELAGDFLNVFPLDERYLGVYVLDVVGHGAAAALLSVTLSRLLSPAAGQSLVLDRRFEDPGDYRITPPAEVASLLNRQLFTDNRSPQYFTMVYGILDTETHEFRYVSAGHPGPLHQQHGGEAVLLQPTSVPIGLLDGIDYEEATLKLEPGDRLFLYTDGLTESMDACGLEFGEERLIQRLDHYRQVEMPEAIGKLMNDVESWRGDRPMRDDTSVLGIEISGSKAFSRQSVGFVDHGHGMVAAG